MTEKEKRETEKKTELANRVARQSHRMKETSQAFEYGLVHTLRWFSSILDKVLFNGKFSRLVAFVLALLMYFSVNGSAIRSLTNGTITSSKSKNDVALVAQYNSDTFEISGLPSTVDVTFTGDATSVTSASNADGYILADLSGLTEGTHTVRLKGEGFGDSVNIKIDPTNVTVTLKKKTTQQFNVSYDLVNQDKMADIYSVGTPQFEYNKINVRASKDTLNTIAFVKALIDVSGQTGDFEQEAELVCYDANGQVVNADIVPNTIHVSVPVSSPSKTVNVEVEVTGEVPNDKAIASISMDQQTVTIYGSETVLSAIDKVTVTLDASTLTKDATVLRPITLPTGVTSSSINQITMSVKLGNKESVTLDEVKINYRYNVNNYKATQPNNQTTVSVIVNGTSDNISNVTAEDIVVYVDMSDARPGTQAFPLYIEQPTNGFVSYELTQTEYDLTVLGETNEDTESEGESNNG